MLPVIIIVCCVYLFVTHCSTICFNSLNKVKKKKIKIYPSSSPLQCKTVPTWFWFCWYPSFFLVISSHPEYVEIFLKDQVRQIPFVNIFNNEEKFHLIKIIPNQASAKVSLLAVQHTHINFQLVQSYNECSSFAVCFGFAKNNFCFLAESLGKNAQLPK